MWHWLVLAGLTAIAAIVVVRPLLRTAPRAGADDESHKAALALSKAQLAEIARDRATGALTEHEADAAEAEIGRRMLALADETGADETGARRPGAKESGAEMQTPQRRPGRFGAIIAGIWIVFGAFAIYLMVGTPGMPDFPFAARKDERARQEIARLPPEQQALAIRAMVENLAARLESAPEDLPGWLRLGRAYRVLGETEKSAAAFARAAALAPQDKDVLLAHGEAMLAAAPENAKLTAPFIAIMRRIQALDGEHPVPLLFLGLAAAEAGDGKSAEDYWSRLRAKLPEGTPERAEVESRIAAAKAKKTPR
ncbi:MAG: c-type cytochrome biogenesis protein CcmI [Alphaproteobacteria bacterium]